VPDVTPGAAEANPQSPGPGLGESAHVVSVEPVRRRPVTMGWPGQTPSAKLREALKGLGAAGDNAPSEGSTPN